MGIQRKAPGPVGIVNASGQPEIVLEIDGLVLSAAPPGTRRPAPPAPATPPATEPTGDDADDPS